MNSSTLSFIIFIITSIIYYLKLKPSLTTSTIESPELFASFERSKNMMLLFYFVSTILFQVGINSYTTINMCGGSIANNIGSSFILTVIPWIFIFGTIITLLMIFPGFKSAFSNVFGYFFISSKANEIITELMEHTEVNASIDSQTNNAEQASLMKQSANSVLKIIENSGLIINEIVPENFVEYWNMLNPLMKQKYQNNQDLNIKQQLLDLIVVKDNIGEGMWYIYTAFLLIVIIQYQIVKRGCKLNLASMKQKHDKYLKKEKQEAKKNLENNKVIYKSTN